MDNIKKPFTVNQIAYLYLIDPLGIEFYMKTNACDSIEFDLEINDMEKIRQRLYFKDRVYEAIFGTSERNGGHFKFTVVDNRACYGWYNDSDRLNIYTNAEVLFGFHSIIRWDWVEFVKSVLEGLFGWAVEDNELGDVINIYKMFFHASGMLEYSSDNVYSYVEDYAKGQTDNLIIEKYKEKYGKEFLKKARKTFHWVFTLISILVDSALGAFDIPNPKDITIYKKVNASPKYLTIIEGLDGDLSMKDIIAHVQQN